MAFTKQQTDEIDKAYKQLEASCGKAQKASGFTVDMMLFFEGHENALPIFRRFHEELIRRFPDAAFRVQKTQITYYVGRVFACVSFARVRRRAELPEPYLVITLGLPSPIQSPRALSTEPYRGRWTNHIVIGDVGELDGELFSWVTEAYAFSSLK